MEHIVIKKAACERHWRLINKKSGAYGFEIDSSTMLIVEPGSLRDSFYIFIKQRGTDAMLAYLTDSSLPQAQFRAIILAGKYLRKQSEDAAAIWKSFKTISGWRRYSKD